jgi:hypothetical protein
MVLIDVPSVEAVGDSARASSGGVTLVRSKGGWEGPLAAGVEGAVS